MISILFNSFFNKICNFPPSIVMISICIFLLSMLFFRHRIKVLSFRQSSIKIKDKVGHQLYRHNSKMGNSNIVEHISAVDDILPKLANDINLMNISKSSIILLSVSGGCDSMAMMHLMQQVKIKYLPNIILKVVNFNHKVRKESDEEAEFVRNCALNYQMEFFSRVMSDENVKRGFTQESSRLWRQQECKSIIESFDHGYERIIATAHHRDDQMETILLKLIRGAHITKLQPMTYRKGIYIRPLLSFGKDQLIEYLASNNYTWREDASNAERNYKRNVVRLDLIPLMADLAGGREALERRLTSLSQQSIEVSQLTETHLTELRRAVSKFSFFGNHIIRFSATVFQKKSRFVFSEFLYDWILEKVGVSLEYKILQEVSSLMSRDLKGRKSLSITISNDWDVVRVGNVEMRLSPRRSEIRYEKGTIGTMSIEYPTFLSIIGLSKNVTGEGIIYGINLPLNLCHSVKIRLSKPGDKFQNKKLSIFLQSHISDSAERDRTLVLVAMDPIDTNRESFIIATALSNGKVYYAFRSDTDKFVDFKFIVQS